MEGGRYTQKLPAESLWWEALGRAMAGIPVRGHHPNPAKAEAIFPETQTPPSSNNPGKGNYLAAGLVCPTPRNPAHPPLGILLAPSPHWIPAADAAAEAKPMGLSRLKGHQ